MNFLILIISFCIFGFGQGKPKQAKLEKIPKSLFLLKKTKINSDVGEPQFYPAEVQLRTIINDPLLHDTKKFE